MSPTASGGAAHSSVGVRQSSAPNRTAGERTVGAPRRTALVGVGLVDSAAVAVRLVGGNLESGAADPTLTVLVRVATGAELRAGNL